MGEYINIYGLLFAKTADGKLAFTGQIWDEELQKFQSDINKLTPQLGEDGKLPADLLPESLKNATSTEVVESLPQTGEANKIYLVKREGSNPVVYDASMWIDGAWASFGGSGGGENNALVFDQEQTLTAEQQNQVLANAGLNIVKIPSALFGTVLSDEDFAAIQNATAIIPIDGNQAGFIFTKAIITPSTIDFFSFNTNFSFRRTTLTISSKMLSTLAATDIKDQVAVKYERQTLTPQQKSIARSNIGAIDSETVDGLLQVVAPTYVGVGGDDLSQYDIADDSPMYAFLVRLIAFMSTIDETSPVFWFYSEDSASNPTQQFGTVVAWSNEEMTFIAMRSDGSISEYQIIGGETGVPTALKRLRTANAFFPEGAVLFSRAQSLADSQKLQARNNIGAASQADVDDINQILFTQYTALSMSRTPASFEKGVETNVTLNWSTKFNNQEIEPDSLEVKKGSEVLTSDKTLKTIGDSVTDTQVYSMTAVIKGITKTASVTVNAYYPMYFGASVNDVLASADVLAMTKQPIKSSPAGNVTIEVGANEYLWLCVPSTMSINSVKSGGFDVPMAAPVTVAVDGKGDYKCYRSASPFAEGTFNGVIA
jgi:hypothetical protein